MTADTPRRQHLLGEFFVEISRLSTWTVVYHQAVSVQLGLNPTDLKSAGLLVETGPITAGELAELTGLTTGAITGVIDRLEKGGFVRRTADPHDRRRVIIEVMPDSTRVAEMGQIFGQLGASTAALLEDYGDEEMALILEFVRRSQRLMREQTATLRETPPVAHKESTRK